MLVFAALWDWVLGEDDFSGVMMICDDDFNSCSMVDVDSCGCDDDPVFVDIVATISSVQAGIMAVFVRSWPVVWMTSGSCL